MSASVSTTAASTVSGITEVTGTGTRPAGGATTRNRNGRRNRGNRGQGATSTMPASRPARASNFKGATAGMNGHVFECYDEQGDRRQFSKTIEALKIYLPTTMKYPEDLAPLFSPAMLLPKIEFPTNPGDKPTKLQEAIWNGEMGEYVKRTRALTGNLATGMVVIWGQCSEAMKSKITTSPQYDLKWAQHDCSWLLREIRAITLKFDDKKNPFVSLLEAKMSYLNCKQGSTQTPHEYLEVMKALVDNIEYQGGSVAESYTMVPERTPDGDLRDVGVRQRMARDWSMGANYIRNADTDRYGTLIADLSNQYARGKDEYPKDITAACGMLVNYTAPYNTRPRQNNTQSTARNSTPAATPTAAATTVTVAPATSAMTFAQSSATAGTNGVTHEDVTCYNCNRVGHYAGDCPEDRPVAPTTGTTLTQVGFVLAQTNAPGIHKDWILLDSQSTVSVFKNAAMLTNIRRSPHVLRALTNGGHQDSTLLGDFPNLGTVWYNNESLANILSLSEVSKVCRVTMDTGTEKAMCVHRLDGTVMKFIEHDSGLYVYSTNNTNQTTAGYTLLSTVAGNKRMFTPREVKAADSARALYRKLGRPSEAEFQTLLRGNFIINCPVTPDDARRALLIYGPDIAVLKGRMTQKSAAARVPTFAAVPIPAPIMIHHRNITLCVDLFFVQGNGFLHTISRDIGYRTATHIPNRKFDTIWRALQAVLRLYAARGLRVCDVHGDAEFDCLRDRLARIALDIVPADSHVGEIERSNRTVQERLRSCVHGLPFKRIPRLMIRHMVHDAIRCLNNFPWKYGVSDTLSPACIVTGAPPPDYNALTLEFGSYVQVFEHNEPSNTPRARSLGAIALCPTGNAQGDYYFLSLATGARISRHQWTEIPITDATIARVEALAKHDGQPLIQERGLVVEWRHDMAIDDATYDLDYDSDTERRDHKRSTDEPLQHDDYSAIDETELDDLRNDFPFPNAPPVGPPPLAAGAEGTIQEEENEPDAFDFEEAHDPDQEDFAEQDSTTDDDDNVADYDEDDVADDADAGAQEAPTDDEADDEAPHENEVDPGAPEAPGAPRNGMRPGAPEALGAPEAPADDALEEADAQVATRYNMRPREPSRPAPFNHAMDQPHSSKSYYPPSQFFLDGRINEKMIFRHVMTQMSAKAAIRKHGKAAEDAMIAEFAQMEDLNVYEPVHAHLLTREQKRRALRAITLVKEKRCGRLKGRTVADGRSQRNLYSKSETASPTVSSDALMLTVMIDAHERRDVATADIAGAYLKAKMDDFVLMKYTGQSVDILCRMNPRYKEFVVIENGVKTLYVKIVMAIYGCVKSALLWYKLFSSALVEMGFALNPYDPCIANKMINGKQCTIAWYVDDTKISHVESAVVTSIIKEIEKRFDKMTVTRGKEHTFLGMQIRYTDEGTAQISMKEYLLEAIAESGLEINNTASTPARRDMFEVDPNAPPLPADRSDAFRSVVMKLLYVATRARVDLLLAISFLSTRTSKSTTEDEGKLKRTLEYIKGAADLEYTLGADNLGQFRSWVDASYATHPDMRSHTGGITSFGIGGMLCKSTKQKLNTKSSTEAEVVGASDYLPNTLWVQLFMRAQGYDILNVFFERDNESAIKMEQNGRTSAGPRSRHIDIRYFWIKDRVKHADVTIRHCPTLQMLADFFTKPLQGHLFRMFRDVLLGYKHVDSLGLAAPVPNVERVGDHELERIKRTVPSTGETTGINDSTTTGVLKSDTKRTWADVVKTTKQREDKKVVSRVHSIETIQN